MAKKEIRIEGDKAYFEMGTKLDSGSESYTIDVEMDFKGVSRSTLIEWCSGGQSRRVALQGALRNTSAEKLQQLADQGLKVHASNCTDLKTREEKLDEAVQALLDLGFTAEEIEAKLGK